MANKPNKCWSDEPWYKQYYQIPHWIPIIYMQNKIILHGLLVCNEFILIQKSFKVFTPTLLLHIMHGSVTEVEDDNKIDNAIRWLDTDWPMILVTKLYVVKLRCDSLTELLYALSLTYLVELIGYDGFNHTKLLPWTSDGYTPSLQHHQHCT